MSRGHIDLGRGRCSFCGAAGAAMTDPGPCPGARWDRDAARRSLSQVLGAAEALQGR